MIRTGSVSTVSAFMIDEFNYLCRDGYNDFNTFYMQVSFLVIVPFECNMVHTVWLIGVALFT